MVEWPSSHSTSNNTYVTGISRASRRIVESLSTCIRRCSSSKLGRLESSNATISPSSTTSRAPKASPRRRSSGYRRVTSLPFRLTSRIRPPSTYPRARMPSHLSSQPQPSPRVPCAASVASIGRRSFGGARRSGSSGGSMRWIIHWSPRVRNSTYLPCTRSPWRVTITSSSSNLWVSNVPASQTPIDPPPYSPAGISPWNVRYSSG